ncbi:hypothetical protein [Kiloniella sp. EL199]|uniref:hypothetical protein n=1 Tax=Kiloniella sp. EL199 TaxID=2107581 RepID=UPI0013C41CF8|nr:hypothetical protein [Kiloniella sp. EL199]
MSDFSFQHHIDAEVSELKAVGNFNEVCRLQVIFDQEFLHQAKGCSNFDGVVVGDGIIDGGDNDPDVFCSPYTESIVRKSEKLRYEGIISYAAKDLKVKSILSSKKIELSVE